MIENNFRLTLRQYKQLFDSNYLEFLTECKFTIASLIAITSHNQGLLPDTISFEDNDTQRQYLTIRERCINFEPMHVMNQVFSGLSYYGQAFFKEFSSRVDYMLVNGITPNLLNYLSITMTSDYRINIRNLARVRKKPEVNIAPQHVTADPLLGV